MSRTPVAGARRRPRTRTLTALAFTVAASVTVLGLTVWPSQAATTPVGNGVYTLASGASGKCVDVVGASLDNSALLVQLACNAAAADQQWKAVAGTGNQFNVVNVNSGRCIDVPSGTTTSGTQLQQYGCGDGTKTNQLWTFTASSAASGKYLVKSVASGLCVSDKDSSTGGSGRAWSNTADGFASTGGGTTGGAGGPTVTVTTYADLLKYATSSSAYSEPKRMKEPNEKGFFYKLFHPSEWGASNPGPTSDSKGASSSGSAAR